MFQRLLGLRQERRNIAQIQEAQRLTIPVVQFLIERQGLIVVVSRLLWRAKNDEGAERRERGGFPSPIFALPCGLKRLLIQTGSLFGSVLVFFRLALVEQS